ncbi:MAG: hypothetical protein ACRENP_29020, partial [Longimicrobiales bacterium]
MSPSVPNDRLPSFDLLSHAWLHDGIAHPKTTVVLNQRGIRQVGQATERSVNDLVSLGLSFSSAARLHEMIRKLLALPPGRLRQIGFMDNADRYQLPRLPAEAIISLCYAASVDDEIEALVWDQNPRNSEAVLARWGYRHDGPMTLEAVGAAFGVTRERARQVVQRQEEDLIRSRVTLPFASGLIHDLEEAGGALPDDNFRTLLRYGLIEVSPQALTLLPELARLGCVPTVSYRADVDLWFTTTGATEWMESGKVDGIKEAARQAARPTLRSLGAVSVLGIQDCSPFGLEHVLHLIRPANSELVRVGHWAV